MNLVALAGNGTPFHEMDFERGYLFDLDARAYVAADEAGELHHVDGAYWSDEVFSDALSEDSDEWIRLARENARYNGYELGEYLDGDDLGGELAHACAFRIIEEA
jgi:hypothetical protein